eukprot:INCI18824.1.p1 GENE.INCI18824.1~~INCI18824.1.p1  ORF type:complete len:177 (-),score=32.44 INCI18824.1:1069-1527(-)
MAAAVSASVRRASVSDLRSVAPLFNAYRMFYGQPTDLVACESFLRDRIERAESTLFVAEVPGATAGFVHLYPLFSSVRLRRTWVLNDLFVSEEFRRSGVANSLMATAEDFARGDGAAQIVLETAEDNIPGQTLYENRGWELERDTRHYAKNL